MNKRIHAFSLTIECGLHVFSMPTDGAILALQSVDGIPTVWVLTDNSGERTDRKFFIAKSAQRFPSDAGLLAYLGTCQVPDPDYHDAVIALHIFAITERSSLVTPDELKRAWSATSQA